MLFRSDPFVEAAAVATLRGAAFGNAAQGLHTGLAPVTSKKENVVTLFASQSGEASLDGEGLDSPFTVAFLRQLGHAAAQDEFVENIRNSVAAITNGRQVPDVAGDVRLIAGVLGRPSGR